MKNTHQAATAVAATYYDSVPNRRLSAHFSLREFVMSAAAVRHNLPNLPDADTERRLKALCDNVLEPLRRRFGRILITSGYRSPKVNALLHSLQRRRRKDVRIHPSQPTLRPTNLRAQPQVGHPLAARQLLRRPQMPTSGVQDGEVSNKVSKTGIYQQTRQT